MTPIQALIAAAEAYYDEPSPTTWSAFTRAVLALKDLRWRERREMAESITTWAELTGKDAA